MAAISLKHLYEIALVKQQVRQESCGRAMIQRSRQGCVDPNGGSNTRSRCMSSMMVVCLHP